MKKRQFWLTIAIVVLVGAAGSMLYLFRQSTEISPEFGEATYRYRWGRPFDVLVDVNRDGHVDYRARVPGVFGASVVPLESWQDPDFEGFFRYHVVYSGGQPAVVEIDENGDGTFDTRLENAEAKAFADKELRMPAEVDDQDNF